MITGAWSDRVGEVIGQRGVMLMDISHAESGMETGGDSWSIQNVSVSHMTAHDQIYFSDYTIHPAAFKTLMTTREVDEKVTVSRNIFAKEEVEGEDAFQFNSIALSLFSSASKTTYGLTHEKSPLYQVDMTKGTYSEGYDGIDPDTGLYSFSYYQMMVDMHAV